MESGQPPLDAGNAFGYITDHGFGFAPPPPHHESFDASAALLSKQEISSMDGFFGSFVDPSSYEFTFSVNDVHLPNQFVGMATSFGTNSLNLDDTQPPHFEPYHIPQPDRAPPPPPPPHALHYPMAPSFDQHHMSGEMLAAAQYLQEGSMLRAAPPQPPANFARLPSTHLRYQPMDDFRQEERRNMRAFDSVNHSNTFTDMFFGAPRPQGPRPTIPMTLQYGSDSRFVDTQPYPAPERESSEVIEREKMRHLQCFDDLHPANGAPGPSNPVIHTNGTLSPGRLKPHPPLPPNHHEDEDEDEYEASTPKGRKGKTVARRSSEEDDDDDDDGSTPPARASKGKSRKRKPKGGDAAPGTNSPATSDGPSKRRKSNANGAPSKLPRENLTDAQKRENHIKSEQKRRGVIKDGYDGLVEAVPGLRGSGYSKAVILASAGDYLERLLEGNEQLRQQLASLGGEL